MGCGQIRVAEPTDLGAITELERGGFAPGDQWSHDTWRREIAAPGRHCLVYCDGEDRVKGVGLFQVVADTADLHRVIVARECRGEGIASRLLCEGERHCWNAGAQRILLEVNPANDPAVALYEKTGFKALTRREGYYAGGVSAVVMEKYCGDVVGCAQSDAPHGTRNGSRNDN